MKKIKFAILFALVSAILTIFTVRAEVLPVKNAWILGKNDIYVLREDGNLYFGDSIDTETPQLILKNIKDFKDKVALHTNGDVYLIDKSLEATIVANNAKEIYSLPFFLYAYIDNNNVLRGRHAHVHEKNTVIMENVKRCYDSDNGGTGLIYTITTDDRLYGVNVARNHINEIMTNVKDIEEVNNDLLILRNNGDLYLYKDSNTPERIGTNIETMDKVAAYGDYPIDFVNANGEYYSYSITDSKGSLKKYMDNVRDVYIIGTRRYVITNDNVLYSFGPYHWGIEPNAKSTAKRNNVVRLMGNTDDFLLGTDNVLYTNPTTNHAATYKSILDNPKTVICYEGWVGFDDDLFLFIKNTGELYGAYAKDYGEPKKTFLTSFCQKPTKVIINEKEIELKAKIQMVNDRSMYPFRECLESMGAVVLWDSVNQIAIGEYNGITIEFPIGKNEYWINGIKYEMDVPSYIDNSIGRTYIPIRYAAEGLGFTVNWTEGSMENIISINK